MIDTKALAREKYQRALRLIEQAQVLLGSACGELSALEHGFTQWKKVGKMYDQVHQLWRDVAYSSARDKVDLDSIHKEELRET